MQEYLNQMTPNELQVLFYVALIVLVLAVIALYQLLKREN